MSIQLHPPLLPYHLVVSRCSMIPVKMMRVDLRVLHIIRLILVVVVVVEVVVLQLVQNRFRKQPHDGIVVLQPIVNPRRTHEEAEEGKEWSMKKHHRTPPPPCFKNLYPPEDPMV